MRIKKIRCAVATTIALLVSFFVVPALPTYFVIFLHRQSNLQQQQQQQLPQQQLHQHQYQQKVGDTYLSAVSRQASADKYIILSVVDEPITDMAINLYETSFKPYNIRNFLFVGFGAQTCIVLSAVSLPCFHYADFNNTQEKASVFNSVEFLTKMTVRNRIVMETLRAGFNVLLTDLDIIFLQNPLPEIKDVMSHVDSAAMWDSTCYNAGFVVIRSTANGIKLWELTCSITSIKNRFNDQLAFNVAIKRLKSANSNATKDGKFGFAMFDTRRYACGRQYFEDGNCYLPRNNLYYNKRNDSSDAWVIHNNWIVSYEAKVYRFKEHLMWAIDKDGYYSSESNVYLVYDNPARLEWSQAADKRVSDQLEALTTALSIGRVLKRIVILPRFHCIHDKSKTLYDCPLNSFIYIPKFDSQFKSSYRESSFLHHPLVPDAIRNSITSQRNVIDRTPNETLSMVTVTSEELQRRFGDVTTRILRLESLYNLRVQFTSPVEQLAFASSIQHALTQCDYRQQIMKQDSGSKVAAGPKK